jgi:hypothetical protein
MTENASKLRLQQDIMHAQKEVIDLTSRLASSSERVVDLQAENKTIDLSFQEMKSVLKDLIDENDRLTRNLNAYVSPGTPQSEKIIQAHAVKVEHELLMSALRRFWNSVGDLPSLPNLLPEEHGVISEAVAALHAYLSAINLLDARRPSQPQPQSIIDISVSTPSSKSHGWAILETQSGGKRTSAHSPQRRSLFRSIVQRR